jgi:nucleotide-binding universal stress UspA family protein
MKILLPVDGSENALRATRFALGVAENCREAVELHLLSVQPAIVSGDVKMFVSQDQIDAYQHDEGLKALAAARAALDAAGLRYVFHIGVGPVAETIAAYAREQDCGQIIMGSRGLGGIKGMLLGSVTTQVMHLVEVPVTLVK